MCLHVAGVTGQSRTPAFLAKNSSGAVPVLEYLMTVHACPSQSQFAGIWKGFTLNRTS
jgi:hypothetical protein